jgi:hypothetical protein
MAADDLADDLLRGARAIAKHVFKSDDDRTRRRVYHKQGKWPIWKDGSDLMSRKSLLNEHFMPTKPAAGEDQVAA